MSEIGFLAFFTAILAAIPWGIAQLAPRWMPKVQTKAQRHTYRMATAAGALTLGAVAALLPALAGLPWLVAIALAVTLDVKWWRFSRTARGRYQLASAKHCAGQEIRNENAKYESEGTNW